ncbi:Mu transposase C-terminal domain-containing protein [Embleya sp. NPDC059259]|uniref:Mu transposase C-terminal domain-containing protein n=1 Tax=unclassified Embleya TaxID=2699296 RepID=UPI0036C75016
MSTWNEDPAAVHRVPADHLRHLLLAGVERTVGKSGIRFAGLSYLAPELHGLGGRIVQIRYMPHDDRSIEVYGDGAHLCTAHPTGHLTPEQTEAFREHARAEAARLGLERRRASRRAGANSRR